MYLNRRNEFSYCALCHEQLAHCGVIIVLSTRGQKPRYQVNSRSWNVCRECLLEMPKHMAECKELAQAIADFDLRAPKPRRRRSLQELLAAYPETPEEKGAEGR